MACTHTTRKLTLALTLAATLASATHAAVADYRLTASFDAPAMSRFDNLPDGRLVFVDSTGVHLENAPGQRTFTNLGQLPDADMSAAAFVRVSPDGQRIAVGNDGGPSYTNYQVGVFNLADLSGGWYNASHYDAAWADDATLLLTAAAGATSAVTALDTASPFDAPVNTTLIRNIAGASAGIALDPQGRLFTGNGYSYGTGSPTGTLKSFEYDHWQAATAPLDFENQGQLVADLLSASAIGFDSQGNLHVGGGSFYDDYNYFALADAADLADALAGQTLLTAANVRQFDPESENDWNSYFVTHNDATGELYAFDPYGSGQVFVYTIPEPAALALLALGALTLRRRSRREA